MGLTRLPDEPCEQPHTGKVNCKRYRDCEIEIFTSDLDVLDAYFLEKPDAMHIIEERDRDCESETSLLDHRYITHGNNPDDVLRFYAQRGIPVLSSAIGPRYHVEDGTCEGIRPNKKDMKWH